MEILFMVFMVIVSIMTLFAVMVVFRDIVQEVIASRRERESQTKCPLQYAQAPVAAEPVAVVAPVAVAAPVAQVAEPEEPAAVEEPVVEEPVVVEEEPVAEEPAVEPEEDDEDDEDKISFSKGQQQTLEEKYLALPSEARGWYDEIIKYASAVEGSKRFKNVRYEEYKVGKNRLVRLLIKRGIIHCEFILHNSDFKNYVNENKISVRQSATTMRIENALTVDAAKNSIDIVVAFIAEEKEYKKQLAREKRRAARAAANAAANEEAGE